MLQIWFRRTDNVTCKRIIVAVTGSRENEAVLRTCRCDMQLCGRISWKQQHTRNLRLSTRTRTTSSTCKIPHWSTCSG